MASPKSGRTGAGIRGDVGKTETDSPRKQTMTEPIGNLGFAPPRADKARSRRRAAALELVATVTLTISQVVAATAVSMGKRSLARGETVERPLLAMPRR
jgi:hypothetical protein